MALEDFMNSNNPSDKRATLVRVATDTLKIHGIDYNITAADRDDFIAGKKSKDFDSVCLCFGLGKSVGKACKLVNKAIKPYGGKFKQDNYGTAFLYLKESEDADTLELPEENDIHYILDNTDPSRIFLTTDWHIFGDHYGKGKNHVNIRDIVSWCKNNIKDSDVFMFLGDLAHRYANKEDQRKAAEIYRSIPGIKVLILGNHDVTTGERFYMNCGFDFIFKELIHNGVLYSHRPKNIEVDPEVYLNIHGHKHDVQTYNVTSGSNSINVYPEFFDNKPATLKYCLSHVGKLTKDNVHDYWSNYTESVLGETKRSELPNSAFGIPEERKYPLDTEKHVNSAIKLFGHAEESRKKRLAKRISKAAKKYNIQIPSNTQVYKYLNESVEHLIPNHINVCIFDMGSVLVGDNTKDKMRESGIIPEELIDGIYESVGKILFNDDGEFLSPKEAMDLFYEKTKEEYKRYTSSIFECISKGLYIYEYSFKLLDELRSKGFKLYYLSNWERWTYEMEEEIFKPLLEKFDGGLFSFAEGCKKPNEEFYRRLLEKYCLDPEMCIFFDDRMENLDGAERVGIKGVQFNYKNTYQMIMDKCCAELAVKEEADVVYQKDTLMVDNNGELTEVNIKNICHWFVSDNRYPGEIAEEDYSKSLIEAIESCEAITEENNQLYVFICNGLRQDLDHCFKAICIGIITVDENKQYEWLVQYPVTVENGEYKGLSVNEWAMNSMNPIQGITKPFILKVSEFDDSISTKQYLLSPDIISDKYLAISEDSTLKIVDAKDVQDLYVEAEYEFIGDKRRLEKINEAYKNGKVVDSTFFYTALTGKPLLTEDQIDFDSNFKKVDFDGIYNSVLSKLATNESQYNNIIGKSYPTVRLFAEPDIYTGTDIKYPFSAMFSMDGYFYESKELNIRSPFFKTLEELRESGTDWIYGGALHG